VPEGSAQFDYLDGQLRASHSALFARFAEASVAAAAACAPELDIAYGPHPRQRFDLFRAEGARRATVAYFHGGYWQSRDKADFRFIAPPLVADGFDVALVNYPLCPEVSVAGIAEAAEAVMAILAGPVLLVGHSAGGQIVVELAMMARERGWDVAGVLAISGVFDLAPLVETTLNARLGLDEAAARAVSPLHRVMAGLPPAIFAVGGDETKAFLGQTRHMAEAWEVAGMTLRSASFRAPTIFRCSRISAAQARCARLCVPWRLAKAPRRNRRRRCGRISRRSRRPFPAPWRSPRPPTGRRRRRDRRFARLPSRNWHC
jgi:arylformamidase